MSDQYQCTPGKLVDVFRHKGVSAVIRLNAPEYRPAEFTDHGIAHHDLIFPDCSTPSDEIVDKFLRIVEAESGVVAVHCLAGLG